MKGGSTEGQSGCPVRRQDLDSSHQRLRRGTAQPEHGIFGPGSMMWRVAGPVPVVPIMLMEAALLEAPHPVIAFGTLGSRSADNFLPRYHRSADAFYDWFFGDLETALATARRVFGYHSRISGDLPEDIGGLRQGTAYHANQQDVLIWVWATIIRPLKEHYEWLEGPLDADDVDRYYIECCRFALLFGIDDSRLPDSWPEFIAYFDDMTASALMEVSSEFLSRSSLLSGESDQTLRAKLMTTWLLSLIAFRLPPRIAGQYPYLPGRNRHRLAAAMTLKAVSVLWPRLPAALRNSPRLCTARRRVDSSMPATRTERWLKAKLAAPYGESFLEAGASGHGNPIFRQPRHRTPVGT